MEEGGSQFENIATMQLILLAFHKKLISKNLKLRDKARGAGCNVFPRVPSWIREAKTVLSCEDQTIGISLPQFQAPGTLNVLNVLLHDQKTSKRLRWPASSPSTGSVRAEVGRYFAKASSTKTLIIVDLAMLAEIEDIHNLLIMDCRSSL